LVSQLSTKAQSSVYRTYGFFKPLQSGIFKQDFVSVSGSNIQVQLMHFVSVSGCSSQVQSMHLNTPAHTSSGSVLIYRFSRQVQWTENCL
jgi:hypothetical protein